MFDLSPHQEIADQDISDLFQQFFTAFEQAVADIGGGTTDIHLRIARENVRLKFAGEHLDWPLSRALLHSRSEPVTAPDFTICVWDSAESGTRLPPELDRFKRYVSAHPNAGLRAIRGNVPIFTNDRFRTALMGETSLTMVDVSRKLCVHWILDPSEIPYYETGAPLRVPFSYLYSSEHRQLLHGGSIGGSDGGVFLGGLGGSGKSTTAVNSLFSPLSYASDDYVIVDIAAEPVAYSLYNTAKLKTIGDAERFGDLASWLANGEGVRSAQEKPMFFLNEHLPQKLINEVPIKAIVFPRFVAGERTKQRPMSQKAAFREVATSTVRQTPGDDQLSISMIGRFIRQLPCFELIFGEDQSDLADNISELIAAHN